MNNKYDKDYDAEAVYYLSLPERPSLYGLADHLGVAYITMHTWRRAHKTFDDAVKKGLEVRSKNISVQCKKYSSTMPNKVMRLFADGKSIGSVCLSLNITRTTLTNWEEQYPKFKEAIEMGRMLEKEHYEQLGNEAMLGKIPDFDSKIWALIVKHRFGYTEKVEVSGNPDAPLLTNITVEFVTKDDKDAK